MKTILILIAFQLLCVLSAFAKGEFQLDACIVESVATTDDKIAFVVSGKCSFMVAKQLDEKGGATVVVSSLNHSTVIIRRHSMKEEPTVRQKDWDRLCETAVSMNGKKIWMDCMLVAFTIEDVHINFISCLAARFGQDHADEAGAQLP